MAKQISSLSVVLNATAAPFEQAFRGAGKSVEVFQSRVTSAGSSILRITGIAAGLSAAFGALKGAASGITLAANLEQTSVAFETLLGSASAAQTMMKQLTDFAAATPFEFPELATAAKSLVAFGVSADQVQPSLSKIGDIASGIGAPIGEIAELFGKAKVQGTLYAQDINQLVGRGIPVIQEFAKQLGVSEGQVKKMASEGKISFDNLDQAFTDLTSSGGKFAGMMEKQSHTLGGLWSTLTDTIGMTMAGLTKTIIDTFNIKAGISALTNGLASAGAAIQSFATTWVPVVIQFGKSVYDAIAPYIAAAANFIAEGWDTALKTTVAFGVAAYSYLSGYFTLIWDIAQKVWDGITIIWAWGASFITDRSADASTNIGTIFGDIASMAKWLAGIITTTMTVAGFAFSHWQDTVVLVGDTIAYQLVKFGNEVIYTFTDVIPGILTWFAGNWRDIFTTIFNFTASVFTNIGKNVMNFASALWSFLKGDGFDFQWTGLLDGFESTIKEMPKIAERQVGPLEQALKDSADAAGETWSDGLADALVKQDEQTKKILDGMHKFSAATIEPPKLKLPEAPDIKVKVDTSQIDAAQEKINNLMPKAILHGSAEAQALQYVPQIPTVKALQNINTPLFGAKANNGLPDTPMATAASHELLFGKPQPQPTARPVPLPPSATKASNDGLAEIMKQVKDLIGAGNRSLLDLVRGQPESSTPTGTATIGV